MKGDHTRRPTPKPRSWRFEASSSRFEVEFLARRTEFWMAHKETHTAAELSSLRSSWYQVCWCSPLHFTCTAAATPAFPHLLRHTLSPASLEGGRTADCPRAC